MSELQSDAPTSLSQSSYDDAAKNNALIAYGLMILGLFTGVLWFVGVIWAMVKKGDAVNSKYFDHYSNVTKIFWWGLGFSILGFVLAFVVVGYFILIATWIWSIYRLVKGLAKITANKAYKG